MAGLPGAQPEFCKVSLPTISVIIAVYNGGQTIGRAIESVRSQSALAHELIVVDDGSTDDTAAVVEKFGKHVRYIYQANAGAAAARNTGAAAAQGDWLVFLDADDWYYHDRLLWHAQWIERDASLDFLTGDYEYRRPDGSLISRSLEITQAGTALLSKLCARSARVGVICEPLGVYLIHPQSATRSDPLRAQRLTVEALLPLRDILGQAPRPVVLGYRGRLRRARLNLGYALLRRGLRAEAVAVALKSLAEDPGAKTLRDFASIARGIVQDRFAGDSG